MDKKSIAPLTSLRFFFALMIFFLHAKESIVIQNNFLKILFAEGTVGVSFFYVLSGFILSYNYLEKFNLKQMSNSEFYSSRIARIYPMHLFTLVIALPFSIKLFKINIILWILEFFSNFFLIQSIIPNRSFFFSFNSVSWSISDELFFYLCFPFILLFLKKTLRLKFIVLASIISLYILLYLTLSNELRYCFFYVNPLYRISEFFIGILLFQLFKLNSLKFFYSNKLKATIMEVLSILIFLYFVAFSSLFPRDLRYSIYYLAPVFLILLSFAYNKGLLSDILSQRIFVLLGEISFSFYLIHYLILEFCFSIGLKYFNNALFFPWQLELILSIIISYLSFKFLEKTLNKPFKLFFLKIFQYFEKPKSSALEEIK